MSRIVPGAGSILLLCGLVALAHALTPKRSDQLERIVEEQCIPHQLRGDDPAPCARVDLSHGRQSGNVLFYESSQRSQYLVMPTARISGIEDPALLRPGTPNFFAIAWADRGKVQTHVKTSLTDDDYSLAINSRWARSQNLLHIHVDCLRRDVRDALRAHRGEVGTQWAPFPVPLAGHQYRAMRLSTADLATLDPFKRLAASLKDPASEMGAHTLILVGETFAGQPGFLLLDDHVDILKGDFAGGESLQDHDCKRDTGS